jgi:hypothetical protein
MVTCSIFWSKAKETWRAAKRFFRKLSKGLRYVPRVAELQRGESRGHAENNQAENSPADQIARAGDETVQISGPRPTLSLSLRNYHIALSSGTTSIQSERLSESDESEIRLWGQVIRVDSAT